MKIQNLFKEFVNGKDNGKSASVFIEGNVLYSYGYHFPLAIRLNNDSEYKFIINKSKYSVTTSKQQTWLKWELNDSEVILEVDTAKIKELVYDKVTDLNQIMLDKLKGE